MLRNPLYTQPVSMSGIALTHIQHIPLALLNFIRLDLALLDMGEAATIFSQNKFLQAHGYQILVT